MSLFSDPPKMAALLKKLGLNLAAALVYRTEALATTPADPFQQAQCWKNAADCFLKAKVIPEAIEALSSAAVYYKVAQDLGDEDAVSELTSIQQLLATVATDHPSEVA